MKKRMWILPWFFAVAALLLGSHTQAADEPKVVAAPAGGAVVVPTIAIDKTELSNGGVIKISGKAPAGKPVYLEVWADDHDVRSSRFDAEPDKETGKRPYLFYITGEMPAYYKIFVPKDLKKVLDEEKKQGNKWSYSKLLKDLGADVAYNEPAKIKIDRLASIIGSRGPLLEAMDEKQTRSRSMQLVKARFRSIGNVLAPEIDIQPDGSYSATIKVRDGVAPGKYKIVAVVDKKVKSEALTFENKISFPTMYLDNAGTSMNLIYPFLLTLVVAIFGVLMGAGGGFIMNPLLLALFPALPHTVVAGTVTPTVLFSQGSGIFNYSKINFISWKLGCGIGVAMLVGGFIGPKLTEMITLDQFKFAFGWILLVLAALMFWQTTPKYLAGNKKEQAILKEFKKRAEESAKSK
jgi:hypothetical protein